MIYIFLYIYILISFYVALYSSVFCTSLCWSWFSVYLSIYLPLYICLATYVCLPVWPCCTCVCLCLFLSLSFYFCVCAFVLCLFLSVCSLVCHSVLPSNSFPSMQLLLNTFEYLNINIFIFLVSTLSHFQVHFAQLSAFHFIKSSFSRSLLQSASPSVVLLLCALAHFQNFPSQTPRSSDLCPYSCTFLSCSLCLSL